jgi:uncharacterized membrane protein
METTVLPDTKKRVKFIDMARSIAILLMLEGHFTGAALNAEYRDTSNILFYIWKVIHGITAPMFFTVTGVIFVYLILGTETQSFWKSERVRKGFRRVGTLLFWGYLVQGNLKALVIDLRGGRTYDYTKIFGTHVLHSIGLCILVILLTYGLYRLIKKGRAYMYFLGMAILFLFLSSILKLHVRQDELALLQDPTLTPSYWPANAPEFIQNMFYGRLSAFSVVNTSLYALSGAALGAYIRLNLDKIQESKFILKIFLIGLSLAVLCVPVFEGIDISMQFLGITDGPLLRMNTPALARLGQVIGVLAILMWIDKLFTLKSGLFLKIGQHTLPIYVLHVIILYGGITGYGLKPDVFNRNLEPIYALLISATAISLSFLLVKYIEPLKKFYNRFILFKRREISK